MGFLREFAKHYITKITMLYTVLQPDSPETKFRDSLKAVALSIREMIERLDVCSVAQIIFQKKEEKKKRKN